MLFRSVSQSRYCTITAEQASIFGRAFDVALQSVINKLLPDADADVVDAVVVDSLRLAAVELDKSVSE